MQLSTDLGNGLTWHIYTGIQSVTPAGSELAGVNGTLGHNQPSLHSHNPQEMAPA